MARIEGAAVPITGTGNPKILYTTNSVSFAGHFTAAYGTPVNAQQLTLLQGAVLTTPMLHFVVDIDDPVTGNMKVDAGGTVVIAVPKRILAEDLATEQHHFEFTYDQLQHYGIKELQVLEDVLRQPYNTDSARLRREISDRIQRRIGWTKPFTGREIEPFLRDFYTAQRAFLESRKNLGDERADKFHTK